MSIIESERSTGLITMKQARENFDKAVLMDQREKEEEDKRWIGLVPLVDKAISGYITRLSTTTLKCDISFGVEVGRDAIGRVCYSVYLSGANETERIAWFRENFLYTTPGQLCMDFLRFYVNKSKFIRGFNVRYNVFDKTRPIKNKIEISWA